MWVKITASVRIAPNRWTYTGVRQVIGTNGDYANGTGFYARTIIGITNPAEAFNTGSGLQGNSINLDTTDCEVMPIRGNPVVAISPTLVNFDEDFEDGTVVWKVIGYPNSIQET